MGVAWVLLRICEFVAWTPSTMKKKKRKKTTTTAKPSTGRARVT